eukprot:g2551.t1
MRAVFGAEIGTVVWPGAQLLGAALAERRWPRGGCAGRSVIELGSGVGLCGIAAAMMGARVVLTERDDLLPLLRANVGAAQVQAAVRAAGGSASAQPLDWTQKGAVARLSASRGGFDLILGADVVYAQAPLGALCSTLCELCPAGAETTLLLAYRERNAAVEGRFFAELKR